MQINTDINILGGLPDFNLIKIFLYENIDSLNKKGSGHQTFTKIKTDKSVKRFEKAITATLVSFKSKDVEHLLKSTITAEGISNDCLLIFFWNASINNDLLDYLNTNVYFPAYYSGRLILRKEEVTACIKELKESESIIQNW